MIDWEWWKTRIVPYFVIAGLSTALTTIWFASTEAVRSFTQDTGQLWVPNGTYILSNSTKNCPSGGWVSAGRLLVQVHNADTRFFSEDDRNYDNQSSNWPGFDAMELAICRKEE